MIKISDEIEQLLSGMDGIGFFYENFGAVVGDDEFVIYRPENSDNFFLAHISEFEQKGVTIRLKVKNG